MIKEYEFNNEKYDTLHNMKGDQEEYIELFIKNIILNKQDYEILKKSSDRWRSSYNVDSLINDGYLLGYMRENLIDMIVLYELYIKKAKEKNFSGYNSLRDKIIKLIRMLNNS